ncbi:MAG: hypothetical protein RLY97_982 [Pseudomonadota bacterium]
MGKLRLDGKVAIVTGSGSEVEVVEQIRPNGGEAVHINASVTEQTGAKAIIDKAIEAYGRLDILVNNAGTSGGTNIPCIPDNLMDEQISIHVYAQMRIVYEA